MDIRVIDSLEEVLACREAWDALLASAENASIFMSWEWNYHWWQHYSAKHSLRIVTAWKSDRLQGILPIYLEHSKIFKFYPLAVARFIGTGGDTSPDYLGPLLEPTTAGETIIALGGFIFDNIPEWQILHLSDLDVSSAFYAELANRCALLRYPQVTGLATRIAYVTLPATWSDYLAGLHRDRRNTVRRTRKKVESQHQGRFYVLTAEEDVDSILSNLIRLHHKRWKGHAEGHAFSTPEYNGFHHDVIHACARRGWIRFYCLEADGVLIAVFYCYRFRNQIFYFQAGFDPEYERLRPGLVLIGCALEHAIEEGNTAFDFLRGDHAYKTQWGKSLRETHALTTYRPGVAAFLFRMHKETIPGLKRLIKKALPFLDRNPHRTTVNAGKPKDV